MNENEERKCKHGKKLAYYSFPEMFKLCKCCEIAEEYNFSVNSAFNQFIDGYCSICLDIKSCIKN